MKDQEDMTIKVAFIRKVYSILLAQIGLSVLAILIPAYYEDADDFLEDKWWLMLTLAGVMIAIELTLICARRLARVKAIGFTLLFAFTFCECYIMAYLAAYFDP